MGYEGVRIMDELDRVMRWALRISPAGRTSLLACESNSAAGHFLKLLRTLIGIRAAFAKMRIESVWAGQLLGCAFGQIRMGRTKLNQDRHKEAENAA